MKVIYTYTDEAPALATHSLAPDHPARSPARRASTSSCATSRSPARILAQFGHGPDALAELGELARTPDANIIKLPNISASIPQLKAAIKELQDDGYDIPDYDGRPGAVRPREGQRGQPGAARGQLGPPRARLGQGVRPQAPALDGRVVAGVAGRTSSTMGAGDFRSTEQSVTLARDDELRIEHVAGGEVTVLREGLKVLEGEIVDAAVMRRAALDAFLEEQVADAKAKGVLFSLHMKATMMKVSDPIIFGHGVRAYFRGRLRAVRRRARQPQQRARGDPGRRRRRT